MRARFLSTVRGATISSLRAINDNVWRREHLKPGPLKIKGKTVPATALHMASGLDGAITMADTTSHSHSSCFPHLIKIYMKLRRNLSHHTAPCLRVCISVLHVVTLISCSCPPQAKHVYVSCMQAVHVISSSRRRLWRPPLMKKSADDGSISGSAAGALDVSS